jgi:hypothetical protein
MNVTRDRRTESTHEVANISFHCKRRQPCFQQSLGHKKRHGQQTATGEYRLANKLFVLQVVATTNRMSRISTPRGQGTQVALCKDKVMNYIHT